MYNEEMKEGFIKEYLKSRVIQQTTLYALFKKTAPFEEELNKDCSEFTKSEAVDMFGKFQSKSVFVLLNNNTILKAYCAYMKYCHNTNNDPAYDDITIDDLNPCVAESKNKLLTREDILDIEDQLYNHVDKAIVELLFNGVSGKNMEDIFAVDESCVVGDKLIVNGKEFPLTERLKELLPNAFAETESMSYGETMRIVPVSGKGRIYKERCNVRGVDSDDAKFRYVYRKVQLFRNYLDMPGLTMKNIAAAGLWYYLSCGMEETGLNLRGFLKTQAGENLATRYGFTKDYYLENICAKYERYVK